MLATAFRGLSEGDTAQGSSLSVFTPYLYLFNKHCSTQEMKLAFAFIDALYFEAVLFYFFWQYWWEQGHGTASIMELLISDPGSLVCSTVLFPEDTNMELIQWGAA